MQVSLVQINHLSNPNIYQPEPKPASRQLDPVAMHGPQNPNLGHGEVCELWQLLDDLREKVIVGANVVRWEGDQVESRETVFRELQRLVEQLERERGRKVFACKGEA